MPTTDDITPRVAPLWARIRGIIRANDERGAHVLWRTTLSPQRERVADIFFHHGVFRECAHSLCYAPALYGLRGATGDISMCVCADHVDEYHRCDDCDRTDVHADDVLVSPDGRRDYCPDCYNERYTECTVCGYAALRDTMDACGTCADCNDI